MMLWVRFLVSTCRALLACCMWFLRQRTASSGPSEALLRAALQSGFGVSIRYEEALSERLLAAGGQDLALFALDHLGRLRFPIQWEKPSLIAPVVGPHLPYPLSSSRRVHREAASFLCTVHQGCSSVEESIAVARKNPSSTRPWDFYENALLIAVRNGWVLGAQLILELPVELVISPNMPLSEAAFKDPNLACLNMLRNSGWGGDLCVHAVWAGRFDVLEQLFQEGSSEPAGASVSTVASGSHGPANWWMSGTHLETSWPRRIREVIERRVFFGPGWQETPSAQHTAYVASLIHVGAAEELAPQIQQWRASARAGALALPAMVGAAVGSIRGEARTCCVQPPAPRPGGHPGAGGSHDSGCSGARRGHCC
eukprot:jgi/Botrbrau1/824/Bobra.0352s0021.1